MSTFSSIIFYVNSDSYRYCRGTSKPSSAAETCDFFRRMNTGSSRIKYVPGSSRGTQKFAKRRAHHEENFEDFAKKHYLLYS